jgi:signal transduction histidine kinase
VRLAATDKLLRLVVSDNGDGFLATEDKLFEGLGLTSMQERLSSIDGELRIASHPGDGTTVEAVAPLPTNAAAFRCSN